MDQQQLMMMLPGLRPEELMVIQSVTTGMSDNQQRQFMAMYSGNRKDGQTLLLLSLVGLLGIAGIQRFIVGQTGMGIAYLLTVGFCGIGSIIDAVSANKLAAEYNQSEAMKAANMVKLMKAS